MARWLPWIVIATVGALMLLSLPSTSPVYDEPYHLTRGMVGWWTGDVRLSYDHPPLGNLLETLPAWPGSAEPFPVEQTRAWGNASLKPITGSWVRDDYPGLVRALGRARLVVVAMTLVLLVVVHRFCVRSYDRRTAAIAVVLLATQPVVLAHGRFVTTDMPVALAIMLAVMACVRYVQRPTLAWALVTATAVAAAALTKYTGLVLLLVLPTLALAFGVAAPPRGRRVGRALGHLLVGGAVICGLIGAAHRFEDYGWTVHDTLHQPVPAAMQGHRETAQGSWLERFPPALRIPLPRRYVLGAVTVAARAKHGRPTRFLGKERERGSPWFFPVLLLVKLTPALLLALGVAAVARARQRSLPRPATTVVLVVTGALVLGAFGSRFNVGFRHLLPAIPLLSILAARGLSLRWAAAGRWGRRALLVLLSCAPLGVLLEHPSYLGYFNVFGGGRANAHRINMVGEDWGQDVAGLARWAAEHPDERIAYLPYVQSIGMAEARHRGLDALELHCRDPLPTDMVVAIHAVMVTRPSCRMGLEIGEHFDSVGEHILLFRTPASQ